MRFDEEEEIENFTNSGKKQKLSKTVIQDSKAKMNSDEEEETEDFSNSEKKQKLSKTVVQDVPELNTQGM